MCFDLIDIQTLMLKSILPLSPTVAVSFPTGNSKQDQAARIEAAIVTLQNLHGPGIGCPSAATTLGAQLKAAQS